jgi:hypothetical protein
MMDILLEGQEDVACVVDLDLLLGQNRTTTKCWIDREG